MKHSAQQMVANARKYIVGLRMDGMFGDRFSGNLDYRQTWQILFAAENLISDPSNLHYVAILSDFGRNNVRVQPLL